MGATGLMESFFVRLEALAKYLESTLRAGAEARAVQHTASTLAASAAGLAAASGPAVEFVRQMARDELSQRVERDLFNPVAAAEPARCLLQAYDALKRQGDEMLMLARDPRFKRRLRWPWMPGVAQRVPPTEVLDQMVGLAGTLGMVARETRLASETILRLHGWQGLFNASEEGDGFAGVRSHTVTQSVIPLPSRSYRSSTQQMHDLQLRLAWLGGLLVQQATAGQQRLERASLDHVAYGPAAVVSEAARLTASLPSLILTCAEIGNLAVHPVDSGRHQCADDPEMPAAPAI